MIAGIAHMAAAGKGVTIVKGPYHRLVQFGYFGQVFWVQKAVVAPMQVNNISSLYIRMMNNRAAKPRKGKWGFAGYKILFSPYSFLNDGAGCPCFLQQICVEVTYLGVFTKFVVYNYFRFDTLVQ